MKNSVQHKIYLLLTCCLIWAKAVIAGPDSTSLYASQVLKPDSEQSRTHAISRLVALKETSTFPLLTAINDKKLYLYQGKAVTTGDKTEDGNKELYPVYEVFPAAKPFTDASGQALKLELDQLEEVEISRADRLLLISIASELNLFSAEPQKRTLAYGQLQESSDPAKADMLAKALQSEHNPDALKAGKEALYSIRLNTATQQNVAKAYLDSIAENWGDNATLLLNDYSEKGRFKTSLGSYAKEKSAELESRYSNLQKAQNFFSGLSLGSILILIALGLSIVYGLAGVINMAHGEFLMIGAYTTYCVQLFFVNILQIGQTDWFFLASLPVSFIMAGIWGFVLERLVIRHLYAKPLESLLATWGVSLILIQIARSIFGDLTAVKAPAILSGGWQILPHLVLPYNRLFIIIFTLVIVLLTYLMLYRSRLGLQIRAVTQNRNMSSCLGIETRRVDAITFFIGSGLAGLAGCSMTLIGNVVPDMGQTYIVDSFLVVVTGGVGKIIGTIVSGLGIGFFSKIFESFFEAVYGKVIILALIMFFLQFKPKGLFPDKGRIAED